MASITLNQLLDSINRRYGWEIKLKPVQEDILNQLLSKKNVFGFLPTGYGKSLIYMLLPLLLDEIDPRNVPHVAIVISPLRSLMFDQVARCHELGIKAGAVTKYEEMLPETIADVRSGKLSVIFSSPEALQVGNWLKYMKEIGDRVCLITFDEVHCLSEWGEAFRPAYIECVNLRSIFTSVPLLGLSGTVTEKVFKDLKDKLQLQTNDVVVKALPPDRPNIFLDVVHQERYNIEDDLNWIINDLSSKQQLFPKTLIFAQTIGQVGDIYEYIKAGLGARAYVNKKFVPENRLVSMYHGQISDGLQKFTLETFKKVESNLRVLISTVAFGMGVEIKDIKQVIHWGKSKSLLCHWQLEVGRCGRDGSLCTAMWYPKSTAGEDKEIFERIKKDRSCCVRETILAAFKLADLPTSVIDFGKRDTCHDKCISCQCIYCLCCSHCRQLCPCRQSL